MKKIHIVLSSLRDGSGGHPQGAWGVAGSRAWLERGQACSKVLFQGREFSILCCHFSDSHPWSRLARLLGRAHHFLEDNSYWQRRSLSGEQMSIPFGSLCCSQVKDPPLRPPQKKRRERSPLWVIVLAWAKQREWPSQESPLTVTNQSHSMGWTAF